MRKLFILIIATLLFSCNTNKNNVILSTTGVLKTDQFIHHYNNAFAALDSSILKQYLLHAEKVHSYASNDFGLKILYADALAGNKRFDEAKSVLNDMLKLHSHKAFDQLYQDDYKFIKQIDNFDFYLNTTAKDTIQISNSSVLYTISEKDLIPEGIAFDKKHKVTYLSSINKRKILAIDSNGNVKDFITTGKDNILATLGMEVDPERRHLWVCSEWENKRRILPDSLLYTGIYKYDLESGELIKKYILKDTVPRLFNDIVIAKNGTAYITESNQAKVFKIDPKKDELELFISSDHSYYANGITISDDNKQLYFSHYFGSTYVVNLEQNTISKLKHCKSINSGRVDGLAFYKNSLIMHQDEICRYYLNELGDSIIKKEVIERNHPLFEISTTGEIAGDKYIYIANSQINKFDNEGYVFSDDKLNPITILTTDLE